MKKLITLLLLMSSSLWAQQSFLIDGIKGHSSRQGVAFLKTTSVDKVQLDCASFLFGITVWDKNDRDFLYLYESECYHIAETISIWSADQQKACLTIDFTGKDWLLEKSNGDCPLSVD